LNVRYLGLDLGERRIGLAVGDDAAGLATPLRSVRRRGGEADVAAVRAAAQAERVDALVFGLPVTLRGEEGPQARRARELGQRIAAELGLPFEFVDERLTTAQASRYRSGRNFDLDAAAAAILLQDHLERRRRS
jgi:putative Holliday junction resolvase